MTAENLKKLTTDALNTLAAALDQGHRETLTALLKTMARFHRYSVHNVYLIATQRPNGDPRSRVPHVAAAGPLRSQRREGNRHPCPDRRPPRRRADGR